MLAIYIKRILIIVFSILLLLLFQHLIITNNQSHKNIWKLKYGRWQVWQPKYRRENVVHLTVEDKKMQLEEEISGPVKATRNEKQELKEQILETATVTDKDKISGFKEEFLETPRVDKHEFSEEISVISKLKEENTNEMKYILQWTSSRDVPFVYMGQGQQGFIDRKCPYTNCIVTSNKSYFGDYTKFDVIAFSGPQVIQLKFLPKKRSPHQKYVFTNIESADNYPVCSNRFDSYFNWTWTYKLDSEVRWGYITIRDRNNNIVGPNKQMNWIKLEDMEPVSEDFKRQLKTKTKAAAWFVSNCNSRSRREDYVQELQAELSKYKLEVDVYGKCGKFKCSRDNEDQCSKLIKETYYFYLSFENSFSEDYVTEKLLRGLQNDAIPIVYGGANYSRFMPNGIYLNARELGVQKLAKKMNDLINDPEEYAEYFKWKKYYSYYRKYASVETEPYCLFCTTLNNKEMVAKTTIYKDFRQWWDPPNRC